MQLKDNNYYAIPKNNITLPSSINIFNQSQNNFSQNHLIQQSINPNKKV